jgi:ComF family protein
LNLPACGRCGAALTTAAGDSICGACLTRTPFFDSSLCAFRFAYPIDHLIRGLKYAQALAHAQVLGELLARQLHLHNVPRPDCLIPVPLSSERFRERGYNQAIELGRFVERAFRVSMRTNLIERIRHTPEQAGLTRDERRKNLRGAFAILREPPPHVAILDDVMTTGSTVNELAQVLRRAGVLRVQVWAVARTA